MALIRGERRALRSHIEHGATSFSTIRSPELALQDSLCENRRSEAPTSSCIWALHKNEGIAEEYAATSDLVTEATITIKEALAPVSAIIQDVRKSIAGKDMAPDELEVEFGIKLTAEAGIIISKIGTEATLNLKASWKKT